MSMDIVAWIILFTGLASILSWYIRDYGLAVSLGLISLGAFCNQLAVFANGGDMPVGIDSDDARLLWLCDIFHVPAFFRFSFARTEITVRSMDIGGDYSAGDFLIFFGVVGIIATVLWQTVRSR